MEDIEKKELKNDELSRESQKRKKVVITTSVVVALAVLTMALLLIFLLPKNKIYIELSANIDNVELTGIGGYNEGESVTISAEEVEGYRFINWTCNGIEISKDREYTFEVKEESKGTYIANYSKIYMITISEGIAHGEIVPLKSEAIEGEEVEIQVLPDERYQLNELYYTYNEEKITIEQKEERYSFIMVAQDIELHAEFIEMEDPIYERVDEEGNPSEDGKYIYFGYYPQTIKNSSVTVEEQPEENGYYKGSDGELYAKVTIEFDVAKYEEGMMLADFSDGTRAEQDQTYYFKVERLRWRILDEQEDGKTLIVCDTIIDNVIWQPNYKYENGKYYATDDEGTILLDEENNKIYANNYKYSQIRYFLNNEFYNSAFSSEQKQMILQTEVDNSLESTLGQGGQYVCENTLDNVFLLSLSDVNNPEYGFKDSSTAESEIDMIDSARNFKTTDFSKAKGSATVTAELLAQMVEGLPPEMVELMEQYSVGAGVGWLRSPNVYNHGYSAFCVSYGIYDNSNENNNDKYGVVPALQIQL